VKSLINWFIDNKVAANLLMLFIIVGGGLTLMNLKQEVFPDAAPDLITISVVHPGATPEEVEEGICIKIEEQIEGLEGVKRITSTAGENFGVVVLELFESAVKSEVLDDVKTRVDAISTFPADAERPVIVDVEMPNVVLELIVSGNADPLTLKGIARSIRDELASLPEISKVEVANANEYEVSIEVSEDQLRRYGLTFDEVVAAVRQNSLNLAGGTVKTRGGEILLRSDTQAYVGEEFEEILLLRSTDGTRVTVGDVATVVDGFADVDMWTTYDDEPALSIIVYRMGDQGAPEVATTVFDFIEEKRPRLTEGIELHVGKNWADLLNQRRDLLLQSGKWGLILIFVLLALFLHLRLSIWTAIGIPTALLGAVWLLPGADVSINMMSLFGFIVVLGILVDDAIVVAENIHHHVRLGKTGRQAAKDGTHEVMVPVTLAVLTTIAAFVPMLNLPGWMGKFARVIPIVVICALIFSLVESLLILPHHLTHLRPRKQRKGAARILTLLSAPLSGPLLWWVDHVYRPVLGLAVRWRYVTLSVGAVAILLTAAMFEGKRIQFVFMPAVEGDQISVTLTMPEGTPVKETEAAMARVQAAVAEIRSELDPDPGNPTVFKHVLVSVGSQPQGLDHPTNVGKGLPTGSNLAEMFVQLLSPETRGGIEAEDIKRDIRDRVGDIPGIREIKYAVAINQAASPISIRLRSDDISVLRAAADELKDHLRTYDGTFDITDDMVAGKRELRLTVTPRAEALGITQAELARQVRQGFYGDEAQRIQRGRDDVKVYVRYPESERRSLADLENMRIRMPGGVEVPFSTVAVAEEGRGPAAIHRADGGRTVTVSSDLDTEVANANEIAAGLQAGYLAGLMERYPGLTWMFVGEQREQSEALMGLMTGAILAMLLIYTLLSLMFGSFVQPIIVITAIPFGMVGAVLGHYFLGHDLTMLSAIGLLAMSGVVVNDSMILIDFVNRLRAQGKSAYEAVLEAGPRRFRAILLTSLTTFAGLTPLLLETSVQAQFLIPMAISLAFGVLFSTFVILLFVPSLYLAGTDVARLWRAIWGGRPAASMTPVADPNDAAPGVEKKDEPAEEEQPARVG